MNKETLKTLAVKTESEEQSRIIVALFETAGFEGDWTDGDCSSCAKDEGYIYINDYDEVVWRNAKVLESYGHKQITFEEFLWDYCAPHWAKYLMESGNTYLWMETKQEKSGLAKWFKGETYETVKNHGWHDKKPISIRPAPIVKPARKNLQDALDKYKDGWPKPCISPKYIGIGWAGSERGVVPFMKGSPVDHELEECYKICTREEFEKAHAERSKPQWPEPGSLPPVGVKCEFDEYLNGKWKKITPKGYWNNFSEMWVESVTVYNIRPEQFRQIQTEREKFIEQAVGGYDVIDAKAFAGDLYDRLKSGELEAPKVGG